VPQSLPKSIRWSQKQRRSRRCTSCGSPSEEFSLCPSHRIEQTQPDEATEGRMIRSLLKALLTPVLQALHGERFGFGVRPANSFPVGTCRGARTQSQPAGRLPHRLDHRASRIERRPPSQRERVLRSSRPAPYQSLASGTGAPQSAARATLRSVLRGKLATQETGASGARSAPGGAHRVRASP